MPKPSEIFDTPAATGFSRVGGNEEQRQEFGLLFGASLSYDQQLLEAIWDWHLTTKDQEKEEAVKAEQMRIKKEIAFHTPALTAKKPKAYNDGLLSGWYACREFVNLLTRALPTEDNK